MFVTHKDVSDELVYEFTKYLMESPEEMAKVHPVAANITPENAKQGFQVPLHPGAEKYYEEVGAIDEK